jgi:hypothetical protein
VCNDTNGGKQISFQILALFSHETPQWSGNNGEVVSLLGAECCIILLGGRLQCFVDRPSAKMWRRRWVELSYGQGDKGPDTHDKYLHACCCEAVEGLGLGC